MTVQLNQRQLETAQRVWNERIGNSGAGTYQSFGQVLPGRNLNTLLGTSALLSTKHDYNFDWGYKDDVNFYDLYALYKREGVANAAVSKTVAKTWETMPCLRENDEEGRDESRVEAEIRKHFMKIRFWQMLKETDKRGLVGEYSGVILQLADSKPLYEPVDRVSGGIKGLVNLIPAWEGQLQISEWDQDRDSPTWGQPKMMTFTESSVDSDQGKTRAFQVHPDRVIIWSPDRTTFNDSLLEPVYNALVDMVKIRGAGAEGFWKNAKSQPVLEIESDPAKAPNLAQLAEMLGTDLEGLPEALDNQVADWNKGFDQSLMLQGISAKTLEVKLPQPQEFYDIAAREVGAAFNIPQKILFGTQTGERASTEDAAQWDKHNMSRRNDLVIPNIFDVVDRLVKYGVLPERDYDLNWPDLTGASEEQRFERMGKMADANQKMAPTGDAVFTPDEMRDVVDLPPLKDDLSGETDDLDDVEDTEE